ncbi:MAG: heme o synthase, partial [Pyrinomonadaceae bacterium]
ERDLDLLMKRTASRPLPSGKLPAVNALVFGVVLTIFGEIYLTVFVNPLTALLGVLVIVGYLFCYTPLKTKTPLSTLIGAIPGAMPPLLGWTSVRPEIGFEAWSLFAIMFYWQIPHFLAIAKMYREDYKSAGILMLPVVDEEGNRTAQQIIISALILIPISILPTMFGMSGMIYFYGALLLGLAFLYKSLVAVGSGSKKDARRLLLSSVLYLPALFVLMIIDRI